LVERIELSDLDSSGEKRFAALERALASRSEGAVAAWAEGPFEAARWAERLVEHGGPSLIHPLPAWYSSPSVSHGAGPQVAHGWVTLAGVRAMERLFASRAAHVEAVELEARGVPEGGDASMAAALHHAFALARRFGREGRIAHARLERERSLQVALDVGGRPWTLRVEVGAEPSLVLRARTSRGEVSWTADARTERLERPGAAARVARAVPWADRALRELAERCLRGSSAPRASFDDARAAHELVAAVECALGRELPPAPLARRACTVALGRAPFARLGLRGAFPDEAPLAPVAPPSTGLPLEALAYVVGLRPALFLTLDPRDEARVRDRLPGFIERRERCVEVGPGDAWNDDRARGVDAVELFVARDLVAARELAALQEGDPTASAEALGARLGYPPCCVRAFVAQPSRADNSYNRYATAARTPSGREPWPALLDDTALKLLPHFGCSYRCEASLAQAEALLEALVRDDAALAERVALFVGGPVLYFDHEHQLRFDGRFEGDAPHGTIAYRGVAIPGFGAGVGLTRGGPDRDSAGAADIRAFGSFAAAVARGDELRFDARALVVRRAGRVLFELERTDPGFGRVLPFGRVSPPAISPTIERPSGPR
jgi:hypothetical protein